MLIGWSIPIYILFVGNIPCLASQVIQRGADGLSRESAVEMHNKARTEANGPKRPPLRWSPSLARAAHTWAAHLAATDHLQHSTGSGQGENLYCSLGQSDVSFSDAVISWVSEKPLYHGEHIPDGDFESYGHYTQIIWPSTREVGMGMARSASGWTYIVARYSPPGNYLSQTPWQ
ncbi:BgTH12-01882 [Blumeria graminis f. sp. triticale]|uniref:BgTH12-01882 n=1 Tax=Blumeria graminis f. sp. triticale TaxID=1689686 RepID=A0A9W4D482_BLUGR|nr:BgTH12-01882 [Blumeria graminis f. sp. triticale]